MSKPAIALLFTLLGTVATHYWNDYIARDKVSIQTMEFLPDAPGFNSDDRVLSKLKRSAHENTPSDYSAWLEDESTTVKDLMVKQERVALSEDDRQTYSAALGRLVAYFDQRIVEVKEFQTQWAAAAQEAKQGMFDRAKELRIVGTLPPDGVVKRIDDQLQPRLSRLSSDREAVNAEWTRAYNFVAQHNRNGAFAAHITLLNTGNTDGLVFPRAQAVFPDQDLVIPIAKVTDHDSSKQDYTAAIVAKRSTAEIWFRPLLDEMTSKQQDQMRGLVKRGGIRALVKLRDIHDLTLDSPLRTLDIGLD